MPTIDGLIVAGGQARRFGGAVKALLEVGGRTVLARQREVLEPRVRRVWLSTNDPTPFADCGLDCVADEHPGAGPLAGIAAGLDASDADGVFAVAGDMPFLSGPVVDALVAAARSAKDVHLIIPAIGDRLEPLHAMYHRDCAPVIRQRLAAGQRKAMDLAGAVPTRRITEVALRALDPDLRFRSNLNSPADLVEG